MKRFKKTKAEVVVEPGKDIDFGVATSAKELIKIHSSKIGIPEEELSQMVNYYYREIVWTKANFYHPRIYIDGIGTFFFRYSKVVPVFRLDGDLPHLSPYTELYKVMRKDEEMKVEKYARKEKGELAPMTKILRLKGDHKRKR